MSPRPNARDAAAGPGWILAAVIIWGVIPFVTAVVAREMLPAELLVIRMSVAGLLLILLAGPRRFWVALRHHLGSFVALALLGFALPNLLFVYALRTPVPIPILSFVGNVYPVWSIAGAVLFLHERPSVYHLLGIGCTVVGLYLMAGITPEGGLQVPAGILLMLGSSVGWASASVISKWLMEKRTVGREIVDGQTVAAARHMLSALLLCPLVIAEGSHLARASTAAWGALLLLILLSVSSYSFYYRGLEKTSVASASLLEALAPVVSLAFGALVYGQGLQGPQVIAACLIFAGSVLVTLRALRSESAGSPTAAPN